MTKRWLRLVPVLFSFYSAAACMPNPESSVQKAAPELTIEGKVEGGTATIFVEQSPAAEAFTAEDGSFIFTLGKDRLEQLRLQYGLQNPVLRLYFVGENAEALNETVNIQYRGAMNLGTIVLQSDTPVNGRIVAGGEPVENARVLLGRKEFFTAADGTFTGLLPAFTTTPLLVEKKGFVQTKGTWLPGTETRDVALYNELSPNGQIEVLPQDRSSSNPLILLNYSSTGSARFIRFAYSEGGLVKAYDPESPWLDLGKTLQLAPSSATTLYYQFADKDQKVLSSVLSLSLAP